MSIRSILVRCTSGSKRVVWKKIMIKIIPLNWSRMSFLSLAAMWTSLSDKLR